MKILLIGLGRFGGAIAKRLLQQGHQIVAIESDPSVVEKFFQSLEAEEIKTERIKVCIGDATSLLVWEYLPLSEFDLIISSLRSGSFNKTICEIVREIYKNYDIPVVVLSFDTSYESFFANYNCRVFTLPEIVANVVEGLTLKNIAKPIGIGLGLNEILEAVVSPRSPYTKVKLDPKRIKHWRLGLVYRGDQIILPKRKILLKPGDRVIILGDDPRIVLEVAKAMALGEPQFPLSFGENLVAALKKEELHYLKEYYYLWKHSRVKSVVLFSNAPKEEIAKSVEDRLFLEHLIVEEWKGYKTILNKRIQANLSAGLISAPYRRKGLFFHNIGLKGFFKQETPFLIPRLSFPYRRILVSLNCENPQGMIEQVYEIFQLVKGEKLTFAAITLPDVLLPKRERLKLERTFKLIEEYGKLYGLWKRVKIIKKEGNPKRKTLKLLENHDLLVVGYVPHGIGLFDPYPPYLLAKDSSKSVLGIPTERAEE